MKTKRFIPSVLVLLLCIVTLGIGIWAVRPASNKIMGTVTINSANANVEITLYRDVVDESHRLTEPRQTRTGLQDLEYGALDLDATYADHPLNVEPTTLIIQIENLSDKELGAYFWEKGEAVTPNAQATLSDIKSGRYIYDGAVATNIFTADYEFYKHLGVGETITMTVTLGSNTLSTDDESFNLPIHLNLEPYTANYDGESSITLPSTYDRTSSNPFTLPTAQDITKDGENLLGWTYQGNWNPDYVPGEVVDFSRISNGEVTFSAIWADGYTFEFVISGIAGYTSNVTKAVRSDSSEVRSPEKLKDVTNNQGLYIIGWASQANQTEVEFEMDSDGDIRIEPYTNILTLNATTTLYPVWGHPYNYGYFIVAPENAIRIALFEELPEGMNEEDLTEAVYMQLMQAMLNNTKIEILDASNNEILQTIYVPTEWGDSELGMAAIGRLSTGLYKIRVYAPTATYIGYGEELESIQFTPGESYIEFTYTHTYDEDIDGAFFIAMLPDMEFTLGEIMIGVSVGPADVYEFIFGDLNELGELTQEDAIAMLCNGTEVVVIDEDDNSESYFVDDEPNSEMSMLALFNAGDGEYTVRVYADDVQCIEIKTFEMEDIFTLTSEYFTTGTDNDRPYVEFGFSYSDIAEYTVGVWFRVVQSNYISD